jgi:hypothetical protein
VPLLFPDGVVEEVNGACKDNDRNDAVADSHFQPPNPRSFPPW